MCGDPPNIIIGTSLGYTFSDFITNTGAVAAICFVLMLGYFTLCFRKELKSAEQRAKMEALTARCKRAEKLLSKVPREMIEKTGGKKERQER